MNKRLIAERFARARNTYTDEARVQHQVAERMLGLLHTHAPAERFRHVVEFGCGTGSYSRLLHHSLTPEQLLLNDLCPEMQECLVELLAADTVTFSPGDAETAVWPVNTDLITSCSTLQWFADPARFFRRCHRFLADDGHLAFSTFGRENMREVKTLTGNGLDYLPIDALATLLTPRYHLLHQSEEIVTLTFATPLDVLKHLRETGVTGTEKRVWTRGKLQTFCHEYTERFATPDGRVTLTYHPVYIIARKHEA
ncbi:MAG: malonyl-ACP O-methyltransferase BioC [Prevotellaceae bacterium]|jgi:malonyl-ACP O-methyltransferase BioC|nr:malonyl-ACP O-methyltransferase BioC [Prevotellaceae bacterium]